MADWCPIFAESSGIRRRLCPSRHAGGEVACAVWEPSPRPTGRLPLLLFLHAKGRDPGQLASVAVPVAAAIAAGALPPLVLACPTGLPEGWYCDQPDGPAVASVIRHDVLPWLEREFACGGSREQRIFAGFSMGGYGAARLAFAEPELCARVELWGAALHTAQFQRDCRPEVFARVFAGDLGRALAASPWQSAQDQAAALRGRTRIRLRVGDRDPVLAKNLLFGQLLQGLGLDPVVEIVPDCEHSLRQILAGAGPDWWAALGGGR